MTNHPDDRPHPSLVLQAAQEEVAPRLLDDYIEAIRTLRAKKFTFREIAEWLGEKFDIETDHNAVWRAYAKTVSDYDAHLEAEHDEELENNEAYREAELNGTLRTFPSPALTELEPTKKHEEAAAKGKRKKASKGKGK